MSRGHIETKNSPVVPPHVSFQCGCLCCLAVHKKWSLVNDIARASQWPPRCRQKVMRWMLLLNDINKRHHLDHYIATIKQSARLVKKRNMLQEKSRVIMKYNEEAQKAQENLTLVLPVRLPLVDTSALDATLTALPTRITTLAVESQVIARQMGDSFFPTHQKNFAFHQLRRDTVELLSDPALQMLYGLMCGHKALESLVFDETHRNILTNCVFYRLNEETRHVLLASLKALLVEPKPVTLLAVALGSQASLSVLPSHPLHHYEGSGGGELQWWCIPVTSHRLEVRCFHGLHRFYTVRGLDNGKEKVIDRLDRVVEFLHTNKCLLSRHVCAQCLTLSAVVLPQCAKCKRVAYCNAECQAVHWKAKHRCECGRFPGKQTNKPK